MIGMATDKLQVVMLPCRHCGKLIPIEQAEQKLLLGMPANFFPEQYIKNS
jgi:hypothetical protein